MGKTPAIYNFYTSREKNIDILIAIINAMSETMHTPILAIMNPLLTDSGNIVEILYRLESVASRAA